MWHLGTGAYLMEGTFIQVESDRVCIYGETKSQREVRNKTGRGKYPQITGSL